MGLYFLPSMSVGGKPLRKVDLLADIRPDVEEEVCDSDTIVLPPPVKPIFVDTCKTGITCIEDYSDSTMRGMKHFYEALSKVKTMKRPVRIAYFGDSFIEADIFTADLREMLQQEFGGCGVGYVPVTSSISGYRPTVRHTFGGWSSHSSNDSVGFDKMQQDISGHYFFPREGAYVQLKGQSKYASRLDTCEVSTFYFLNKGFAAVRSKVNNAVEGELHEEVGTGGVQAVSVRGRIGQVRWSVEQADSVTFYGVAMADASSKSIRILFPWLCSPAKASVLFSLHGMASIRQLFSLPFSLANMAVAVTVNRGLPINRLYHFMSSGHVLVLSWVSVLAVTTPLVYSWVDMDQRISQATRHDFPMPCPEATASLTILFLIFTPSRMLLRMSFCHSSGPFMFSSGPGAPQGNAKYTNFNGSWAYAPKASASSIAGSFGTFSCFFDSCTYAYVSFDFNFLFISPGV